MINIVKLTDYTCLFSEVKDLLNMDKRQRFIKERSFRGIKVTPKSDTEIIKILGQEPWNIPRVGINSNMERILKTKEAITIEELQYRYQNMVYVRCRGGHTWPSDLFYIAGRKVKSQKDLKL